jgi:hypothetical protein
MLCHYKDMSSNASRTPRLVLLGVAVALLASCSALQLAYDHADYLVRRTLTSFVGLDRGQARALEVQVEDLHRWHRARELPAYSALLDEAALRVERRLQVADVSWAMGEVQDRMSALGTQFAAEIAPVVASLSPAQIDELEANLTADLHKWEQTWVADGGAQAARRRAEWMTARIEDWVGELNAAQREGVARLSLATAGFPALRAAERKRRQDELIALMRRERDFATIARELTAMFEQPERGASAVYVKATRNFEREFGRMLLDLDASLTPKQRGHLVSRLHWLAREFKSLASVRQAEQAQTPGT